jgi:two-component system sensor histidine kinase PhoQ
LGIIDRFLKRWLPSLRARVLWTVFTVVLLFVAVTAVVLDRGFEKGLIARLKIQLEVQTHSLLGAAEELSPGNLFLPEAFQDDSLNQLSSGRYARVLNVNGEEVWKSLSAVGLNWPLSPPLLSGEVLFYKTYIDSKPVFARDFGVTWESSDPAKEDSFYTFQVAESRDGIDAAVNEFRQQLYMWLGLLGLALLIIQFLILQFGLGPLKKIEAELQLVELGQLSKLDEDHPQEIRALANRINLLLLFEENQRRRYRDSLGDLAHSLKTPLALMTSINEEQQNSSTESEISEQIARVNKTISYYLNRAMVIGAGSVLTPIQVAPIVVQILQAMEKVYFDKKVNCKTYSNEYCQFFGNEGDLMELLGNLIDNAYKYCQQQVIIRLEQNHSGFQISIENDGADIKSSSREDVMKRGARLDEKGLAKGQGIGLSVVMDIVRAYDATLEIDTSTLGGARFRVNFKNPGA